MKTTEKPYFPRMAKKYLNAFFSNKKLFSLVEQSECRHRSELVALLFKFQNTSLDPLILPADLIDWSQDYLESSDAKLTKHSSFDLQSLKHMYDLGYTFRIIFTVPYKTATIFAFQMYLILPLKLLHQNFRYKKHIRILQLIHATKVPHFRSASF